MIRPEQRTRPLPEGGLEAAMTAGRRRRRIFLGGTGAGFATATALVLALSSSGPASRSLEYTDDPTPTASPQGPAATSSPSSLPTAPEGQPTPTSAQSSNGSAGAGGNAPSGAPVRTHNPGAQPQDYLERPATHVNTGCTSVSADGGSFCGSGFKVVQGHVPRGLPVDVEFDMCDPYGEPRPLDFGYTSGQEQELVASRGSTPVWRFSDSVRFTQGPHTRSIPIGQCVTWHISWPTVDDQGASLPPGDYALTYHLTMDTWNGSTTTFHDARFSGTVTLTD